eukprot:NODE_102_length_20354_cov_0.272018.p9 type:complete len:226 gc:universal NODE_102_length_20354_cov_0.272018:1165-1842(+)
MLVIALQTLTSTDTLSDFNKFTINSIPPTNDLIISLPPAMFATQGPIDLGAAACSLGCFDFSKDHMYLTPSRSYIIFNKSLSYAQAPKTSVICSSSKTFVVFIIEIILSKMFNDLTACLPSFIDDSSKSKLTTETKTRSFVRLRNGNIFSGSLNKQTFRADSLSFDMFFNATNNSFDISKFSISIISISFSKAWFSFIMRRDSGSFAQFAIVLVTFRFNSVSFEE